MSEVGAEAVSTYAFRFFEVDLVPRLLADIRSSKALAVAPTFGLAELPSATGVFIVLVAGVSYSALSLESAIEEGPLESDTGLVAPRLVAPRLVEAFIVGI